MKKISIFIPKQLDKIIETDEALFECAKVVEENKVLCSEMADWNTVIADGLNNDESW